MAPVAFREHVELLRLFLARREAIAGEIEALLNGLRKPSWPAQDSAALARQFEDRFFAQAASGGHLRGQLEAAYWAAGFKPRQVQHLYNDLIAPAEMALRAVHCWQRTHWPGRNGRMHYGQTLFNLYVLRHLQFLSLRLWDDGASGAGARLVELQGVLDDLWRSSPSNQPALLRDARWLIPLAQSLITDELAPYFETGRRAAEELPAPDALEVQRAHVRMLGGHLTSQIRYYCTKDGLPIGHPSVALRTRNTNALDFALLVHGLVALLKTYDEALRAGDAPLRRRMAGAIWQGISPDPELFLHRHDLLRAYTMIEHLFIAPTGDAFSPVGERHVRLFSEYRERIGRLLDPLHEDLPQFRPVAGVCSPYGVIFGLPSTLIEHMALKATQHHAETRFCLEDVFEEEDPGGAKLAWVNGWRDLPHIPRAVQQAFAYPQDFAEEVYGRMQRAAVGAAVKSGRLHIVSADADAAAPELPVPYFVSSDPELVAAGKAEPYDPAQLLRERQEGLFLATYETPRGWMALKKDLLTEVLGAGRDARVAGLPQGAAGVLRLMLGDLGCSL